MYKDTEDLVLAYDSTDGVYSTTVEAVALLISNSTLVDSPWHVTRHLYSRSFGFTRGCLVIVYLLFDYQRSRATQGCPLHVPPQSHLTAADNPLIRH